MHPNTGGWTGKKGSENKGAPLLLNVLQAFKERAKIA